MKRRLLQLPRSLRAQMVLSTLLIIVLVQVASFATVTWSWRRFTQNVAVDLTVTTLHTLRSALAGMPAADRAAFVQSASEGQWRLWSRTLPDAARLEPIRRRPARQAGMRARHEPPRNDVRRMLRSFVETLNQRLDDDGTRVLLSHGRDPKLYISLQDRLDPDADVAPVAREWLVIPLDRIAPPMATPVILLWLAGMGGFLVLALIFSWHITRPLTRLAAAADQLAAGQPQRVQPAGPSETRALGERFNAMLDALEEARSVRRTLLAGLPHDLKGPLSRMWLRLEMLDDARIRDGLRQDVQDMQRMVDQFIGFVRGSDPASHDFAPMDLQAWLHERVAGWQETGVDIALRATAQGELRVRADRLALDRVLDNLITNALHHGKPPIRLTLSASADTVLLEIADHGPGIRPAQRAEALRPFSRLDEARTRTGSVGLGLALADAIIHAHQGSILLDSTADGGLLVRILLPRLSAA